MSFPRVSVDGCERKEEVLLGWDCMYAILCNLMMV